MVKSKKTQIIFRSIFLVISLVGIIGSFGTFKGVYNPNFYLYFANLSNYFCFFAVLALLFDDVRCVKAGITHKESDIAPIFRFSTCVMIVLTFAVYNVILSNPFQAGYWLNFQSLIMHLICPVMYIVDFMIFSKHRTLKLWAPLCACIFPFIYVFYILVRAEIYVGTGKFVYPYFFLDVYSFGFSNVMLYIFFITIGVLAVGFALWAYDKLVRNENGKLVWDFSSLPKPEPVVVEEKREESVEEVKEEEQVQEVNLVNQEDKTPKTRKPRTVKPKTEEQTAVKKSETSKKTTTANKTTTRNSSETKKSVTAKKTAETKKTTTSKSNTRKKKVEE